MRCYCGCTQWMGPKHALSCAECGRPNEKRNLRYGFISRHNPTPEQIDLALAIGIDLIPVGDLDAFADDLSAQIETIDSAHNMDGIVCVHPLIALVANNLSLPVGIFRNATRPGIDGKPQFFADKLVIWR